MSDSVRPHRRQPTRLRRPWDSPGKNTGVGCHFFLQCKKVKGESEVAQSCPTLSDPMDCSLPRLLRPWDLPGKSTAVGCHRLLRLPNVLESPQLSWDKLQTFTEPRGTLDEIEGILESVLLVGGHWGKLVSDGVAKTEVLPSVF